VRLTLLFCAAALSQAQSSQAQPSPPPGLEPQWDIAIVLEEIGANAARLLPALDKVDARSWVAKGASDTYVAQWESSKEQARAIMDGARALAKNPERLSSALELFFRIEGLERMLGSVAEGARKYQGAQTAQSLAALHAEGGANRERFRGYMINLATEREHQFEVMDKEAQRCRATLMAPAPPKTTGRKK
jgi:hypothetical protein